MKQSSQAATTAAQNAVNKRGSKGIQTQFGNEIKYYIRNGCVYVANLFASGTLLQTFLSARGLTGAQIGVLLAAINAAQTITILLFSTVVDKVRNSVKSSVFFMMFMPLFSLVMLPFTLMEGLSSDTLVSAVLLAGTVQNIFYGLYIILDYRIPYEIIDMKDYGRMNSLNSVVGGVLMVAVSGLTTLLLYRFDVGPVFFCMYLLSAACMVTGMMVTRSMRVVAPMMEESVRKKTGLLSTLKMRAFRALLLPNLMRGFNNGVMGMLATVGMFELGLNAGQTSTMSLVYTVMSVIGPLAFLRLQRSMRLHNILIIASAMVLGMMSLLMVGHSFGIFLCVYVVLLLFVGIVDNLMPVLVTRIIPYENIGSYTSLRMGTHMAGLSLGSMVAGAALGHVPAALLLICSGALQLGSGLCYWLYCRKMNQDLF